MATSKQTLSIIKDSIDPATGRYVPDSADIKKADAKKDALSQYTPTPEESLCREEFLKDFRNSWQTMHLPRPEYNDMSHYQRYIIDMLAFNTYQENDGNPLQEDRLGGWQSQAMRPIIRNAAISIAAHQTARQLVPKIFAYNNSNEEQEDVAKVMSYLVDWAREQANYPYQALYRNIMALYAPISWGLTEYVESYRTVKDKKENGKWTYKKELDEDESGFKHTPLACDQVYFPNFYERDPQKQDFLIIRRIVSYDRVKQRYPVAQFPNMVHVKPGIIVTMDDANRGYYNIYDPHMRQDEVEEVIRWRKSCDSKDIMVNGVLITEPWAANERADHMYPLDAFYYLPINERCIGGKSLTFALQNDAKLANEWYQMVTDAGKLNLFPPTVTSGSDKTGMDVIVPGLNLAFSDKDVTIDALKTADAGMIQMGMNILEKIEQSLHESSQSPIQQGQEKLGPASTAYEISRIESNASTVLGLTIKFFTYMHVIPYGKLLLSDILQYLTMPQVEDITGEKGLLYKTFYVKEPGKSGQQNKISFDANMPEEMTDQEKLDMSWMLLKAQGGLKSTTTLLKVNPILFRDHKFKFAVDADVLNPRSAELERAYDLETYDRAIGSPVANQEEIFKDLLMSSNPKTERNPDKYVMKQEAPVMQEANGQPGKPSASKPSSPSANQVR